jgi:replicative DNA helicase
MMSNQTGNPPSPTLLRPSSDQETTRVLPTNSEAEQSLLGALFIDNKAYSRVAGHLRAEHFGWSVHRRIFTAIGQVIAAGKKANRRV